VWYVAAHSRQPFQQPDLKIIPIPGAGYATAWATGLGPGI